MKIVIYDEETRKILDIIEHAEDVTFTDGCLSWSTGTLTELKKPFVVLPDDADVNVNGDVSEDDIASGTIEETPSEEEQLRKRNEELQKRLNMLEEVTQEIIVNLFQ